MLPTDQPSSSPAAEVDLAQFRSDLQCVARNYSWVWDRDRKGLLRTVLGTGTDVWGGATHPFGALDGTSDEDLQAKGSEALAVAANKHARAVRTLECNNPGLEVDVAYFSPEFGVSETLPQYSGGLGILAGDHLKAASDTGVSLVGVGLFYANGYFDQGLANNQQAVSYQTYEPSALGLESTGHTVSVDLPRGTVRADIWLARIGATRLYLLDSRVAENEPWAQQVTDRLYSGDQAHRIEQEWLLGVGGARALQALGIEAKSMHLNEGHAGFLILELLADRLASGSSLEEAQRWVRRRTLFTTHTPVPAGIDRFPVELLRPVINLWASKLETVHTGVADAVWGAGELPSETDGDLFNMAAFCLRHAGLSNGVSTLHGEVSRELFGSLEEGAAITSVTNGVHALTWMAPQTQRLLETHLGPGFSSGDESQWGRADSITNDEITTLRTDLRREMVDYLREQHGFDELQPDILTVGFARRFATYKRAALLLEERDALIALLHDDDHPVQFVFAGKAHPADRDGQRVFQEIAEFGASPEANGRFVLVPGYDMAVASHLYGGCDVWLNTPVKPQEACGTSGEKSALNGGLNCSILDGWWAEWYQDKNGWAIDSRKTAEDSHTNGTAGQRDATEAANLIELFRTELVPMFYEDAPAWIQRIRYGWQYLGPKVTAARMVMEYEQRLYQTLRQAPEQPNR